MGEGVRIGEGMMMVPDAFWVEDDVIWIPKMVSMVKTLCI